MRKVIIIGALGLSLLVLLRVYATPPTASSYWTVQLRSAHGLRVGDPVEEAGQRIGEIVAIEPRIDATGKPGTDVLLSLDPGFGDRVRERSTFFVSTEPGSRGPVLSLVVFDEHSPAVPAGNAISGADSEMELELKRQMAAMEGAVQEFSRQLEQFSYAVDKASRSEEKRRLEESMGGFVDTLRHTRDDLERVLKEEMDRWKKLYNRFFLPERPKPVRAVS